MSASTKSNTSPAAHVMTPAQLARRFECDARATGIPGLTTVGRYRYTTAYEHLRTQSHPDELLLCFLARGRQTYRVNQTHHHLRGGDQYLVFPGEPHDSAGFPEEKGELYWLGLRVRPAGQPFLFLDRTASAALRRTLLVLPSRHFAAETGTRELLEELIQQLPNPRSKIEQLIAASAVLRLLLATVRASHRNHHDEPSPRIRRCLAHVATHVHEPLYVPELARAIGLSESRFKVRFRREVGLPPGEYILREKIATACTQLQRSDITVTAVAHDLGFSSSQYFATVFRRFTGKTPGSYRKQQFK